MAIYSQLLRTISLGKLGARVHQASKARTDKERREAMAGIVTSMASLHGLPQKIGQILSLNDLGSEDSTFHNLSGVQATTEDELGHEWIEKGLGQPITRLFAELSTEAYPASIGQVYQGLTHDGRKVAVKVQYPKVKDSIITDLSTLGWLAAPISAKRSGFNLSSYKRVLKESLLAELDYDRERDALYRFQEYLKEDDRIRVPEPIPELCSETVLTMTWMEGETFERVMKWSHSEKSRIAQCLLQFFLRSWLEWGEIHADPHPGNFKFSRKQGMLYMAVIDFGCVRKISLKEKYAIMDILDPCIGCDAQALMNAYIQLGFDEELLRPMYQKLPEVTAAILKPFLHAGPFDPHEWRLAEHIEQILGEDRWNFRYAGPAELLHFIRALSGVIQYITALGVNLNWKLELDKVLSQVHLDQGVQPACKQEPPLVESPRVSQLPSDKHLKIRVLERGQTRVQLTFGVKALSSLMELMPPDLLLKLAERDINPQQLAEERLREGCTNGELFRLADGEKLVKVWIE